MTKRARQERLVKVLSNMIASILTGATVAVLMIASDAPTWAWVGAWAMTYFMVLPNRGQE